VLLQRVLTALVLVPLVVAGVLWLDTPQFGAALGLLTAGAAWEWSRLAGYSSAAIRAVFVTLLAAGLWLLWPQVSGGAFLSAILVLAVAFWLVLAVRVWRVQRIELLAVPDGVQMLVGCLVLGASWVALVGLHRSSEEGPALVLFTLVLVWVADTAAFFAGRRWGSVKLAPLVSPGKTWAGLWGAVGGAVFCALVLWLWLDGGWLRFAGFLVLCVSVFGDLYESLLKRQRGLKDSGSLLPGHGGILDRIDSLIAAAPVFAAGLLWLGRAG